MMSHRDIATILGISHARVQQIEQKALAKIALGLRLPLAECAPIIRRAMLRLRGRSRT
jgi:Sigma-70, region 4